MARILFVMTGADHWTLSDGTKHPTGFWAEEAAAPYRVFTGAGHEVVVATPGGAAPMADEASLAPGANGGEEGAAAVRRTLEEMTVLREPLPLEEVDAGDFDAVFYPGGHGPMEDLSADEDSARLLVSALEARTPLGVVCHGPAALLPTARSGGESPFSGYRMTGFTNAEERQAGLADKAPWLLQDRLEAMGVDFAEGEPWAPNVVVDGSLYTGQNPASSEPLAQEMLTALR